MNYILGSAVKLFCSVDVNDGTTAFIEYIKDPDGNEVVSDQSMSETTNPSTGFVYIWQSLSSYTSGKYTARFKAINGIYTNYQDHKFFMREE